MKYYIVDAFTDKLFGGNQAGVCVPDAPIDAELMQNIAIENNFSETAFLVNKGPGDYDLRWFTPGGEIDFSVAESEMVPGRAFRRVVNMKVDQPVPARQQEGHVLLPGGLGVADVPGEAEAGAFQEQRDRFLLITAESVGVLHGDHERRAADPFPAQVAETAAVFQIAVFIPLVHLYFPVRQGDMDSMVHVHVDCQRL